MQNYMEHKLIGLHESGQRGNFKQKLATCGLATFLIFIIPFLHFGFIYYLWAPDKPTINRGKCTCECFDTVFRGRYEWPPSNYKHFYFNSTSRMIQIWFVVIIGVLGLYECVRYIAPLLWRRRVRVPMFALLISAAYPHYYGWWASIQSYQSMNQNIPFSNHSISNMCLDPDTTTLYLNEEYWPQWYHQLFFSVTELLSTLTVLHLCNKETPVLPWKLLVIFNINLLHIFIAGSDSFIGNVIYGRGQVFEALRDFALLLPDIFHVLVSYFELRILAERKKVPFWRLFYREELMMSGLVIILFTLLGNDIPSPP